MNKIRLLSVLTLGLFCVVFTGAAQKDQNQSDMAFAFGDETGTRLLSVDDITNPQYLAYAIFSGGIIENAKFMRRQERAADWNGRQIAKYFDCCPGVLFEIEKGKIPDRQQPGIGESCLLVSKQFLQNRREVAIKSEPGISASNDVIRRIERSKGKNVEWAKTIARIGSDRDLLLVRFVPDDEKVCLASLVLVAADSLSFDDHEAKFDRDAKAFIWRVDTDGIDPESFHVLAAFDGKQGIEIAVLWNAFEGQNFFMLRPQGPILRQIYSSYRYWTPV